MSHVATHPVASHGGDGDGAARRGALCGFLAEFDSPEVLKAAAAKVRDAGYRDWDTHSPFPVHGIDEAMGIRMTRLPILVFVIGLAGTLTAIALQWWTNATSFEQFPGVDTFLQGYNFMVSGKPYWSFPANIPIVFELTVLFAALTAGFGMLVFNNLPWWNNPIFNARRFARATTDRFFIRVDVSDPKFHAVHTEKFLHGLGAAAIERIEEFPGGETPPAILRHGAIVLAVVALIPLTLIGIARNNKSTQPRIHLIQDMDNQPRYKAQQANPAFQDGRAMRSPVGASREAPLGLTVARGELHADDHYYRGYRFERDPAGGMMPVFFDTFPRRVPVDTALIRRGRDRFNVSCAPCHGVDGRGNGAVNNRAMELGGWVQAQDLHDAERRSRPVGHIFNTISNGIRTMPQYGDVIPESDRWAIVAYVRALQRSTAVPIDDPAIPDDVRRELKSRKPAPPPATETPQPGKPQ